MTGEICALLSAATWAIASLVFARLSSREDARAINFVKCVIGALMLWVSLVVVEGHAWPALPPGDQLALALSGLLGLSLADTAYFRALAGLGAQRGVLFVSLVPVVTAILAVPFLHEAITARMGLGMALTLTGTALVVLQPAKDALPPVRLGPLIAGLVYVVAQAIANIVIKRVDASAQPLDVATARLVWGALALGVMVLVSKPARDSVPRIVKRPTISRVFVTTFLGTYVGVWLATYALRTIAAGVATTLTATTPLFALGISRVVLHETLTPRSVIGAVLAVLGVATLVV